MFARYLQIKNAIPALLIPLEHTLSLLNEIPLHENIRDHKYSLVNHSQVSEFENSLSRRLGGLPVFGTGSGTDALIIAMKALNVGPGDEVIIPAFGCVSLAFSVSWVNSRPVFVDIEDDTFAIHPEKIEEKITSKTKAIIFAHLYGQPAVTILKILDIARRHGLSLIEDAAQVFCAKIYRSGQWQDAGTFGDISCFSFSPTKQFCAPGSGGAIVVRENQLKDSIDRMRFYGAKVFYYDHPTVGVSAKMDEVHAAALIAKLPFLSFWLEYRRILAKHFNEKLSGVGDIVLPPNKEADTKRIWYRYVIRTKKRNQLFDHLQKTFKHKPQLLPKIHYPVLLPDLSAYNADWVSRDFPIAKRVSSEILTLPLNDAMSLNDVDVVCKTIKNFMNNTV